VPTRRAWIWAVPPENYPVYVKTGTFAIRKVGRKHLDDVQPGDTLFAYLSGSKVIAGMFEATSAAFQDTTPLVTKGTYPWRVRVRPLVRLSEEAFVPYDAFHDRLEVTREYDGDFGAVVRQVLHPLPRVDEKVLEFLVRARQASGMELEKVMAAYGEYLTARREQQSARAAVEEPHAAYEPSRPFDRAAAMEHLIDHIAARGYVYAPWEVAAYVTAVRTKPFVILAGVTGTGKSKLPALVEAATGGASGLIPVRPDWTDSADVLGYVDLAGRFRPGAVLQVAREAAQEPLRHVTVIIDEMNLARVEQYFAEVLSRLEDRRRATGSGYATGPLLDLPLPAADADWARVRVPPNLALVGTVNMDESAHGFSRKVLDRAFTLELSDVDLTAWAQADEALPEPVRWPVQAWHPRAIRLAELENLSDDERATIDRAVEALDAANAWLAPAQLHVAYRTRDEVALFLLHATATPEAFRTRDGTSVNPLDLALHMKVLPRLAGGSRALRQAVRGLLGWAVTGAAFRDDADARSVLDAWDAAGRPNAYSDARFPRTAARLCLMWERLLTEGFTSFWV
jgi:MoxR-like ATPase